MKKKYITLILAALMIMTSVNIYAANSRYNNIKSNTYRVTPRFEDNLYSVPLSSTFNFLSKSQEYSKWYTFGNTRDKNQKYYSQKYEMNFHNTKDYDIYLIFDEHSLKTYDTDYLWILRNYDGDNGGLTADYHNESDKNTLYVYYGGNNVVLIPAHTTKTIHYELLIDSSVFNDRYIANNTLNTNFSFEFEIVKTDDWNNAAIYECYTIPNCETGFYGCSSCGFYHYSGKQ